MLPAGASGRRFGRGRRRARGIPGPRSLPDTTRSPSARRGRIGLGRLRPSAPRSRPRARRAAVAQAPPTIGATPRGVREPPRSGEPNRRPTARSSGLGQCRAREACSKARRGGERRRAAGPRRLGRLCPRAKGRIGPGLQGRSRPRGARQTARRRARFRYECSSSAIQNSPSSRHS